MFTCMHIFPLLLIGDSADTGHFTLAEDGLIGTGRLLDREDKDKYKVEVKSCDDGVPPK